MNLFVSYPKSGRTWLRFMLDSYLCRLHGVEHRNVFEIEESQLEGRRVEWSHLTSAMMARVPYWSMGCFNSRPLSGARAVLLVRRLPDTLASAYDHAVHRIKVFTGSPGEFIRSPWFGAIKLVTFYNLWEGLTPIFSRRLVLSYDAMREDPRPAMERMLEFFDIECDAPLLTEVIAESTIANMRRLSTTPEYAGSVLAPTDPSNPNSFKVRSGGSARAEELLSNDGRAYIQTVSGALLMDAEVGRLAQATGTPATALASAGGPAEQSAA